MASPGRRCGGSIALPLCLAGVSDLEASYRMSEAFGLLPLTVAGRRGFLDHRRVLSRILIHLADRDVDLLKGRRLLSGAIGDFRNDFGDVDDLDDDAFEGFARLDDKGHAGAHFGGGRADQIFDLLCRLRRSLRQSAHLRGHDGESAPRFSRSRRLNAGVEGEKFVWKAISSMAPMI